MERQDYISKEIIFSSTRRASALEFIPGADIPQILPALKLEKPPLLIMISGGASVTRIGKQDQERLSDLFTVGIANAALHLGATIVDGGTDAGVMQMMGRGVAAYDHRSVLVGVVPDAKVSYPNKSISGSAEAGIALERNHSHFVLVRGEEWGSETETMYSLAKELANGMPVLTMLAGGGNYCKKEVLQAVQNGWSIIVIEGSGGFADRLALLWRQREKLIDGEQKLSDSLRVDPMEIEILTHGKLLLFPITGSPRLLEKRIVHQYQKRRYDLNHDSTLKRAWQVYARYDDNAGRQQRQYRRGQNWILLLGILSIILVTSQQQGLASLLPGIAQPLHYSIVLVPVSISFLLSLGNRFNAGNKWVVLRGNAELIKSEIYYYRTHTHLYNEPEAVRQAKLMQRLNAINDQLLDTEVMNSAFHLRANGFPTGLDLTIDDGLSELSAEHYLVVRLEDQLAFYQRKILALDKRARRFRWLMYATGGVGTLLAAAGFELWVALTTTIFSACATYLEYEQTENTLRKYNIVATLLENVKSWWIALTPEGKNLLENKEKLVSSTESALREEGMGWMALLQDAVSKTSDSERTGKIGS